MSTSDKKVDKNVSNTPFETSKKSSLENFFLLVHEIILHFYHLIQMNESLSLNNLLICSSHCHHSNQCQTVKYLVYEQK